MNDTGSRSMTMIFASGLTAPMFAAAAAERRYGVEASPRSWPGRQRPKRAA